MKEWKTAIPSQTDGRGKCHVCHGHATRPPDGNMWNNPGSEWAATQWGSTHRGGRQQLVVLRWRSGISHPPHPPPPSSRFPCLQPEKKRNCCSLLCHSICALCQDNADYWSCRTLCQLGQNIDYWTSTAHQKREKKREETRHWLTSCCSKSYSYWT